MTDFFCLLIKRPNFAKQPILWHLIKNKRIPLTELKIILPITITIEDVHWNWFCVLHFSIDTHYNQFYVNTFEFSIWECLTMCRKHVSLSISIDEDTFPNKSIHSNWTEFILNVFIIDSWSAGFVVVVVIIFLSFLFYSVLNKTTTVRLITSIRRYRERKIVVCHRKHKSLTPSFFFRLLYIFCNAWKSKISFEKKRSVTWWLTT